MEASPINTELSRIWKPLEGSYLSTIETCTIDDVMGEELPPTPTTISNGLSHGQNLFLELLSLEVSFSTVRRPLSRTTILFS